MGVYNWSHTGEVYPWYGDLLLRLERYRLDRRWDFLPVEMFAYMDIFRDELARSDGPGTSPTPAGRMPMPDHVVRNVAGDMVSWIWPIDLGHVEVVIRSDEVPTVWFYRSGDLVGCLPVDWDHVHRLRGIVCESRSLDPGMLCTSLASIVSGNPDDGMADVVDTLTAVATAYHNGTPGS